MLKSKYFSYINFEFIRTHAIYDLFGGSTGKKSFNPKFVYQVVYMVGGAHLPPI